MDCRWFAISVVAPKVTRHIELDVDAGRDLICSRRAGRRANISLTAFIRTSKAATAAAICGAPTADSVWFCCGQHRLEVESPREGAATRLENRPEHDDWVAVFSCMVAADVGKLIWMFSPYIPENSILVVDDSPRIFEFYWKIFNDDPHEFDPLPPQANSVQRYPLVLHYLECFDKFEQMFAQMIDGGKRHPLCIIDMRSKRENNNRRGFETVRLVRELDPDISILVATALPDIELEDLREVAGKNSFLFRLPMTDEAERANFRNTVHRLVDRWNAKERMMRSVRKSAPVPVPLSEVFNGICDKSDGKKAAIERYINPGLSVRSHREPLAQGLDCVVRHAVVTAPPNGCVRVFGEGTSSGATVTVVNEAGEVPRRSLADLMEENLGFFLFEAFLRLAGGSLKVESGGSTLTADIRHV